MHQNIKANFLMSPPLVVAFALAGTVDIDLSKDPTRQRKDGAPVYLKDIWPTLGEIHEAMSSALKPEVFRRLYTDFATLNPKWNEIPSSVGEVYAWDDKSTYIQEPPFFENFGMEPGHISEIKGARPLGIFGDSVTTDHISPAGAIKKSSPAGKFLLESGVGQDDFNSYGLTSRQRPHHDPRHLRQCAHQEPHGARRGGWRDQAPARRRADVDLRRLDAISGGRHTAHHLRRPGIRHRLVARLGGQRHAPARRESRRRAELRAHPPQQSLRHGPCPLQFPEGVNAASLKLNGTETFDVLGLSDDIAPMSDVTLVIHRADGTTDQLTVKSRIDTAIEVEYVRHGGILPFVLRQLLGA